MICKASFSFHLISYVYFCHQRVFIDADKKEYLNYLKMLLGEDVDEKGTSISLLNDKALIVVDNTLWKGLVLKEVIIDDFL